MKESSPSNPFSDLADHLMNHLNTWIKNEPTPRLASLDLGDFSTIIYDFFTGDQTGINFITNIGLQVPFLLQGGNPSSFAKSQNQFNTIAVCI